MSIDFYEELSFFYLAYLPIDKLRHFNVLLFLDVNIINSDLNNIDKGSLFLSSNNFTFIFPWWRPKLSAETCRVYDK
jgi:hypothetical protein